MFKCLLCLIVILSLFSFLTCADTNVGSQSVSINLSTQKKASQPVVISQSASNRVRAVAALLAEYLDKISGAEFKVVTGDGKIGIAVGTLSDFPDLPIKNIFVHRDAEHRESYILRSHQEGIYIIGLTEIAVEHACWDFLYRLGYRQFFPGSKWEIIPNLSNITVSLDLEETPDYFERMIWPGFGLLPCQEKPYLEWVARNRLNYINDSIVQTGHQYETILKEYKDMLEKEHPEYLALVDGERKWHLEQKFCLTNARYFLVKWAMDYLAKHPTDRWISMEPSDGDYWCECDGCLKLGSPSDRAVILANAVAEEAVKQFGARYVGIYAYNKHSLPPSIKVHPNVRVCVATAFLSSDSTVEEMMNGWKKQGATIGVREYYSVHAWDRDLPGILGSYAYFPSRGGNIRYLKQTIPAFYKMNARFMTSEASVNWGPNGLGYLVASRLLWNTNEDVNGIIKDFLNKAFENAAEPMSKFYDLIDSSNYRVLTDDMIGQMYRCLNEAKKKTDDAAIYNRINDLILWIHYIELYRNYFESPENQRQQAFENVCRFAYRIQDTFMIHTRGLIDDEAIQDRDKLASFPNNTKSDVPEELNPWKQNKPLTQAEIDSYMSNGIEEYKIIKFKPVTFSSDLKPAKNFFKPNIPTENPLGSMSSYLRGTFDNRSYHTCVNYYTWIEPNSKSIPLKVTTGYVYPCKYDTKILFHYLGNDGEKVVDAQIIPNDLKVHNITIKTDNSGLHRIEIINGSVGTLLEWPDGTCMSLRLAEGDVLNSGGRWSLYFYVPKGTQFVRGTLVGSGKILDGNRNKIHEFENQPNQAFCIEVPENQDGKFWSFSNINGNCTLASVPPYLAQSPLELLLPIEVLK